MIFGWSAEVFWSLGTVSSWSPGVCGRPVTVALVVVVGPLAGPLVDASARGRAYGGGRAEEQVSHRGARLFAVWSVELARTET